MGFLSKLFGSLSGEPRATDNFELIALNMALIRHALETDHADRFPDEETLYIACGVWDTLLHIADGHFTVQDVKDAMLPAKLGECRLGQARIQIEYPTGAASTAVADLFLNYALQIEAMIFYADEHFLDPTGISDQDILLALLDKKHDIARVLRTPENKLARSKLAAGVREMVAVFMDSPEYADFRSDIGLE